MAALSSAVSRSKMLVTLSADGPYFAIRPGEPAAEPAAPVVLEPRELELETIVASWPMVIDLVRQENAMLSALLGDARPVALVDGTLTVTFPAGADFLKRKAEQDDYRRATADAFRAVTGNTLNLRYELRDPEEHHEPVDAPALSGEELVQRFKQEFDAEELDDGELNDPDQHEAR